MPKSIARAAGPRAVDGTLLPYLLGHLCPLVGGDDAVAEAAVLAYIEAMAPEDAIEEILIAEMLAPFYAGMDCLRRAGREVNKLGLRDVELRHGEKLLNLFSRQFEAFEKRRHRLKVDRLVPGLLALPQAPRG